MYSKVSSSSSFRQPGIPTKLTVPRGVAVPHAAAAAAGAPVAGRGKCGGGQGKKNQLAITRFENC